MTERMPIDPEKQFVVALTGQKVTWGPFLSRDAAEVRTLSSPTGELLAWRKAMERIEEEMNRG